MKDPVTQPNPPLFRRGHTVAHVHQSLTLSGSSTSANQMTGAELKPPLSNAETHVRLLGGCFPGRGCIAIRNIGNLTIFSLLHFLSFFWGCLAFCSTWCHSDRGGGSGYKLSRFATISGFDISFQHFPFYHPFNHFFFRTTIGFWVRLFVKKVSDRAQYDYRVFPVFCFEAGRYFSVCLKQIRSHPGRPLSGEVFPPGCSC